MANRNYPSKQLYSFHVKPVRLDCQIIIGASGAVSSFNGLGIASVTLLKTGVYQVQLQDNYFQLTGIDADMVSPVTGSAVVATSLTASTLYKIVSLGTTNFNLIGVPNGIAPAIGMPFVATGAGTGTGTAIAIGNSGIGAIELAATTIPSPGAINPALTNSNASIGGVILIQTLAATSSSVTTAIPAAPASGSIILLKIDLNDSSVQ